MATQWGTITGNINDQQDLITTTNSIKSSVVPATSSSAGTMKLSDSISILSDGTISTSPRGKLGDVVKVLTEPNFSAVEGNYFYYKCTGDTEFNISSSSSAHFCSMRLFIQGAGDFATSWKTSSGNPINWNDGIGPVFTERDALDEVELITNDGGETWFGNFMMSDIGAVHKTRITDTEGVRHLTTEIVDDGTYTFDFNESENRPLESYVGDISFDSLTSINSENFMAYLMNIDNYAFKKLNVKNISFPVCAEISNCGLTGFMPYHPSKINLINFPALITVSEDGLQGAWSDDKIGEINFPELTSVSSEGMYGAFEYCKIDTLNMPKLQTVGDSGMSNTFQGAKFKSPIVSFPSLQKVTGETGMDYIFAWLNIVEISFPSLTQIGDHGMTYAFRDCENLETVSMPALKRIDSCGLDWAFAGCVSLRSISFPSLTFIDIGGLTQTFIYCENLEEVHFRADKENDEAFVEEVGIAEIPDTATIYWDL